MIRIFDFSAKPEQTGGIQLHMTEQVREGFDSVLIVRLGDFPPSVLAAIWHDVEFDGDGCTSKETSFREVVAQVYYDNCGEDIADYYNKGGTIQ